LKGKQQQQPAASSGASNLATANIPIGPSVLGPLVAQQHLQERDISLVKIAIKPREQPATSTSSRRDLCKENE
jgi:hypothetical protein